MAAVAEDLPAEAAPPPTPLYRTLNGLTAAAQRIGGDRKVIPADTQAAEDIWRFYDAVPEVKFIGRFYGNAMSRIAMVPSVLIGDDPVPVPVDEAVEDNGLPLAVADLARRTLARLSSTPDGMSGLMRAWGENLAMVGDSVLIGRDATDADEVLGDEVWQVYSVSCVKEEEAAGGRIIKVRETPGASWQEVPGDPIGLRVWRRHARWPGWADSNLRACINECEELLIWGRYMRAVGRSGTSAGLIKVPIGLDHPDAAPIDPESSDPLTSLVAVGPDRMTELERKIYRQFIEPVEDSGDKSAAAVAPGMVRGRAEDLTALAFMTLDRPIDERVPARIEALVVRLARGADLPLEIVTGLGDANHWSGWQIEDSTYKAHIEPTAQIAAAATTGYFLRPQMREQGAGVDGLDEWLPRMVVGLDPSGLVVRPNRAADARELWDRNVLPDDALLEAHNFAGTVASDEERILRYLLARSTGSPQITAELLNRTIMEDDPIPVPAASTAGGTAGGSGDGDGDGGEDGGDATPSTEGDPEVPETARAVLAAAGPVDALGGQLAAIERALRERLTTAASASLEGVLRRAGARLRGAVQGRPEAAEVNGQPPELVGLVLGEARAVDVVDPDTLLAGAFDDLRPRWDAWVAAAEADAVAAVNTVAGDGGPGVEATSPEDSERGWAALLAGLLALARARLFAAAEDGPGEVDVHSVVPAGVVRDALSVAGASTPGVVPLGSAGQSGPPGLFTGPRWRLLLGAVDIEPTGWVWSTGFPSTPFEPHQRLSGTEFSTWDDPALNNGSTWPRTSHYYPGDHRGCQCDAIAVLTRRGGR